MKEAYANMREFWLDVRNLENKNGIPTLGDDKICIAGVELCMLDNNNDPKNILIAASVLGDASMYFENNSKSGLGGFLGGGADEASKELKSAAKNMLKEAASRTKDMLPSINILPPQEIPGKVTLFALSADKGFYMHQDVNILAKSNMPFHKFYAFSQQMISAFRKQQEDTAPSK